MEEKTKGDYKFIILTIPMFMGYATCFNLYRYLKEAAYIDSGTFSVAYSFLYLGNLLFRFFHNYFWIFTRPIWRIVISYSFMIASEVFQIMAQVIKFRPENNNSWIAFAVFFCGGVGIGTFESNSLNVLSRVSGNARHAGVIGIPVGINLITIGSFFLIAALEPVMTPGHTCILIFCTTICMCCVAIVVLLCYVPHGSFITSAADREADLTTSILYLPRAFREYKTWFMPILPCAIAMCANMFTVSQFAPGITLYTFNSAQIVPCFGINMKTDYYRALLGAFGFLTSFSARFFFEKVQFAFPPLFNFCNLVGALMTCSGVPEICLLGYILIYFADGCIYVQASKFIQKVTECTQWNLAAYSAWLFIGDFGAVCASFSQQAIVKSLCGWARDLSSAWDPCRWYWEA